MRLATIKDLERMFGRAHGRVLQRGHQAYPLEMVVPETDF